MFAAGGCQCEGTIRIAEVCAVAFLGCVAWQAGGGVFQGQSLRSAAFVMEWVTWTGCGF